MSRSRPKPEVVIALDRNKISADFHSKDNIHFWSRRSNGRMLNNDTLTDMGKTKMATETVSRFTSARNKISAPFMLMFSMIANNISWAMCCNARLRPTSEKPTWNPGIHKPEIFRYVRFRDVGFLTFGSNAGPLVWRLRKHVYSSWNVKNALFDTTVITISGLWLLQDFGRHIWFLALIIFRRCRAYVH